MNKIIDGIKKVIYNFYIEYKAMVNWLIFMIILFSFISFIGFIDGNKSCRDSIIEITTPDKTCDNGAKLKFVSNQWICSCEK